MTVEQVLEAGMFFHLASIGISRQARWLSMVLLYLFLKSFYFSPSLLHWPSFSCFSSEERARAVCAQKRISATYFSKWFNALTNPRSKLHQALCHAASTGNCCCQKVSLMSKVRRTLNKQWKALKFLILPALCAFLETFLLFLFLILYLESYSSLATYCKNKMEKIQYNQPACNA